MANVFKKENVKLIVIAHRVGKFAHPADVWIGACISSVLGITSAEMATAFQQAARPMLTVNPMSAVMLGIAFSWWDHLPSP